MDEPAADGSCPAETGEPCATVTRESLGGWWYLVACSRSGKQVRGWKGSRDPAAREAALWIDKFCSRCDRPEILEL